MTAVFIRAQLPKPLVRSAGKALTTTARYASQRRGAFAAERSVLVTISSDQIEAPISRPAKRAKIIIPRTERGRALSAPAGGVGQGRCPSSATARYFTSTQDHESGGSTECESPNLAPPRRRLDPERWMHSLLLAPRAPASVLYIEGNGDFPWRRRTDHARGEPRRWCLSYARRRDPHPRHSY